MSSSGTGASTSDQMNQAADQAQEKLGLAKEKASELRGQATDKADQGLDQAAGGLGKAADMVRQQAEGDGPVPAQVSMIADRLEQASSYFEGKDTNEIISDLETFIRSKPVESVVGAVAIGFILAKIVR